MEHEYSGLAFSNFARRAFNTLTIGNECIRHATLAVCYQMSQTVLKIGFALAKTGKGEVGRFQHGVPCTWQLAWAFLSLFPQTIVNKAPLYF